MKNQKTKPVTKSAMLAELRAAIASYGDPEENYEDEVRPGVLRTLRRLRAAVAFISGKAVTA
jgi:TATA-box binding protein (TBP) (component of TFIID and TFIIIB)